VGPDKFFWPTDYPHSNHPAIYMEDIKGLVEGMDETGKRGILGENAKRTYNSIKTGNKTRQGGRATHDQGTGPEAGGLDIPVAPMLHAGCGYYFSGKCCQVSLFRRGPRGSLSGPRTKS
jgi:hypothetical protein